MLKIYRPEKILKMQRNVYGKFKYITALVIVISFYLISPL